MFARTILTLSFVLLLAVILMVAVAPMIVQDITTGTAGGALRNVMESIDSVNEALEDSPIGDFFRAVDGN
jgi:hypothetical protein